MKPPDETEPFDSILDTPDSPPARPQTSMGVITIDSSSPTSPGPSGHQVVSPTPMDVSEEDFQLEDLLSPEAQQTRSPGMLRRHDPKEEDMVIYRNDIEFFEALKNSYQNQEGNPNLGQGIVIEDPDQKGASLLELAKVIKDLFREGGEGDSEDRKFALHDLQLHSIPCISQVVEMVRTVSSQEDLATFYREADIKDKLLPKGPEVSKHTARKLTHWTATITKLGEAANNFLFEQVKMDPTSLTTKTIQTAKEVVSLMMKENLMLKTQLRTLEESEGLYKETTLNQLTSIEEEVRQNKERMLNMETLLQVWSNRNPTRPYNEVAAGVSDWWSIPTHQPKRSRTDTVIQSIHQNPAQSAHQNPAQPGHQIPAQPAHPEPAQLIQIHPVQIHPVPQGPPQPGLSEAQSLQQTPPLVSQPKPAPPIQYGGQPGPIPHGPAWNHEGQDAAQGSQYQTLRGLHHEPAPRAPALAEAQGSSLPPAQRMNQDMIQNLKLFPMTLTEAKDEATLKRSINHLNNVENTANKIFQDLERKHPDHMADLQSLHPSGNVQKHYHYLAYQLTLKTTLPGLHKFLNEQPPAEPNMMAEKFRFPNLRPGTKYQKGIYGQASFRMKNESNQRLLTLYCPNLARSIFVVEKVFQIKSQSRFWLDPKEGTTESISSLKLMILILVEQMLTDVATAKKNPEHFSLTGFQGNPFPEDSDGDLRCHMEWATAGRNPLKTAITMAEKRASFTTQICNEARLIALAKNTTFLSGKDKMNKARHEAALKRTAAKAVTPSPRPSPPKDMPLFRT